MKFFHFIFNNALIYSCTSMSAILDKATEMHLDKGEYSVSTSYEPS